MKIVRVYLRIYAASLGRALTGCARNAWTLLLPIALWAVVLAAGSLFGGLGLAGGLLFGLLLDAVCSSYLYFTGEIVADAKARFGELKTSFLAYFWAVMGLAFVVWVAELLLGTALAANPNRALILLLVRAAAFVVCNAAPEVIYQKGANGGIATIQQSVRFIHENWIEWFIPNIVLSVAYGGVLSLLFRSSAPVWMIAVIAGALLHVWMVFRGHLFRIFDTSAHRQRMFRWGGDARV